MPLIKNINLKELLHFINKVYHPKYWPLVVPKKFCEYKPLIGIHKTTGPGKLTARISAFRNGLYARISASP